MRSIKFLTYCTLVLVLLSSCQKKDIIEAIEQKLNEPTEEQLDKLFNMGINIDNVSIEEITNLDGKTSKYLVSGDILVPISELDSYANLKALYGNNKEYRDINIVSLQNRNIDILGYTGGNAGLTSKMQTALKWAVNNYNALPNSLNFNLTFGTDQEAADIVVYKVDESSAGGSAGFPNFLGEPYKWIRINSGTDDFTINVNEHIISHEIGHCIGLRHQDWFNHHSCGDTTDFSLAEPPAIWISGKSTSSDTNSIMLSCFETSEDGEFTDTDKNTLNILY